MAVSSLLVPTVDRFSDSTLGYLNELDDLWSVTLPGGSNDIVRQWPWVATTAVPQGKWRTAANLKQQCWKQNFLTVHCSGYKHFQLYHKCQKMAINTVTAFFVFSRIYIYIYISWKAHYVIWTAFSLKLNTTLLHIPLLVSDGSDLDFFLI